MELSVVMIVRDDARALKKCLKSLDEAQLLREGDELLVVDTGSADDSAEVARQAGARVILRPDLITQLNGEIQEWLPELAEEVEEKGWFERGILRSFAEARNVALTEARHDIQFWIDSDDVLKEEEPGQLRKAVDIAFGSGAADHVFLDYDYAVNEHGNVTAVHKRERLYDRRVFSWKGPCHEVLIPRDGSEMKSPAVFGDLKTRILHMKDHRGEGRAANVRNYLMLRRAIEEEEREKGLADIRLYYYFANACRGLERWDEAEDFYELTLDHSGSRDDCYLSCHALATIHLQAGRIQPATARRWAFEAVKIRPEDPRGYTLLQSAAFLMRRWEESLWWFQVAQNMPAVEFDLHIRNPEETYAIPFGTAALAHKELGNHGQALACAAEAVRRRPENPDLVSLHEEVKNWAAGKRLTASLVGVAHNLQLSKLTDELRASEREQRLREMVSELQAVPRELESGGLGRREPADERTGKDLVIFCGGTLEDWGPTSAARGLAGSERAVVEMSRRLQARGLKVTVYCSCPPDERGVDRETGVLWRHFSEFDRDRARGTVLFWRSPELMEQPIQARRRFVWCHDVQMPARWKPAYVSMVDGVFVLSEYHRTTLAGALPDSKVVVTQNGIDVELLSEALGEVKRNPKKVMFFSSPDRGLLTAVDIFSRAHEKDSELELHVYYGFSKNWYDNAAKAWAFHIPDLETSCRCDTYFERCDRAMRAPGVVNHGRVGWRDMARELASSGVWLYPTRFPEISCISAMEAQAAGLGLVTTDYAALSETVDWSSPMAFKITLEDKEKAADAVLVATRLSEEKRRAASAIALERFTWDRVADRWAELLDPEAS